MNQKTKELWLIPTTIALATGIPLGAGFMLLGLWLGGTPIHPLFSLEMLKMALLASLPVWGHPDCSLRGHHLRWTVIKAARPSG